jgi:nicotinate-nucleotide pyrophosphorylase (carboxylating)
LIVSDRLGDGVIGILRNALVEDLGAAGDITSRAIFDDADMGVAEIRAKQPGVLSGVSLAGPLYRLVDDYLLMLKSSGPSSIQPPAQLSAQFSAESSTRSSIQSSESIHPTKIEILCNDGDPLEPGKVICRIRGPVKSILAGERVILNLLQHLSGISTITAKMADALKINNGKTHLLDTRKTTPGLRALEKAAVLHGGGVNHRIGLYDMILIKDTHVKRAGGVKAALSKALASRNGRDAPLIEVEVQSAEEFFEALPLKPDRIMLDNMSLRDMEICVGGRDESGLRVELEASGNVSLSSLSAIAATGVDFVSCGAITHSAPALDIHLVMV